MSDTADNDSGNNRGVDNRIGRFYAKDRAEWRAWLEQNHAASTGIW